MCSLLDCECNSVGSVSQVCDKESGHCTCKSKYSGRTCNQCEAGYYNYPTCKRKYLKYCINGISYQVVEDTIATIIRN